MSSNNKLSVKLIKSISGRLASHKACVAGLGLKKINQERIVLDTVENRGMINKVSYLLEIKEL